jgi:hypothetical protein
MCGVVVLASTSEGYWAVGITKTTKAVFVGGLLVVLDIGKMYVYFVNWKDSKFFCWIIPTHTLVAPKNWTEAGEG